MLGVVRSKYDVRAHADSVHVPAPVGGINAIDSGGAMPASDCIVLWNMLASEYGLRARLGYRVWSKGVTGLADNLVRTVIPFHGQTGSGDKLFVATSTGIWDATETGSTTAARVVDTDYEADDFVTEGGLTFGCKTGGTSHASNAMPSLWAVSTAYSVGDRVINSGNVYICVDAGNSAGSGDGPTGTSAGIVDDGVIWDYESADSAISDGTVTWVYKSSNTAPTEVVSFGTDTGDAGYGIFTTVANTAGAHFLAYCDEVNGYYLYTESSDTWAAGSVTGVSAGVLVFPCVFKNRLWFVEKDTGNAWYTDTVGAISGACTKFQMGHKFLHGGYLVGLWSFTLDGGSGPDDLLVAVSSGGDLLVWKLDDPSDASTIELKGVWYLGGLPKYRRIATDYGGDTIFLTKSGAVPLSRLVAAALATQKEVHATYKISNLFNSLMVSKGSQHGWSINLHPEDNALLITVPTTAEQATQQLVQSNGTKAWSRYKDLPIYSCGVWGGKMYFGTTDGRICINDGYVDNVLLADSNSYNDITFSLITAFVTLGNANQKQIQTVRPHWLADGGAVAFKVEGRYNFNLDEADSPSAADVGGDVWDTGIWDTALWSGEYAATNAIRGVVGMGTHMAIAIKGRSRSRTVLTGMDVTFKQGGVL